MILYGVYKLKCT